MATLIQMQDIRKAYARSDGTVRALDGVSLDVEAGEFVVVQGPSGCGKTTLLLAAGGLLAPDQGRVLADGQDVYALAPDSRAAFRAATIGFVFQEFHLIPYLSVLDNVLAASLASRTPDARGRAKELIAHFGLTQRTHHVPAELSTGERQRTALARALLNRPRILLADEPTGNLDTDNARAVLEHLEHFARDGGAVLLVTHGTEASDYARRIVNLRDGKVSPA